MAHHDASLPIWQLLAQPEQSSKCYDGIGHVTHAQHLNGTVNGPLFERS